jgi:hypothetical protein
MARRKHITPGERVGLKLSVTERELIPDKQTGKTYK